MSAYPPARYNPLAAWEAIPANETPEQRKTREVAEETARKRSARIDEDIKAERAALKKRAVKLLVLGQSESGKSTTIKNFQLAYTYQSWTDDRLSWRAVIFLNLVRSVNTVLHIIGCEMNTQLPSPSSSTPSSPLSSAASSSSIGSDGLPPPKKEPLGTRHKLLRMRLSPLTHVQRDLEQQIGAGASEVAPPASVLNQIDVSEDDAVPFLAAERQGRRLTTEFAVRATWMDTLTQLRTRDSLGSELKVSERKLKEVMGILAGCCADIKALWTDRTVRAVLVKRGVRLEDSPGFFLDDLERILSPTYEPTDKDVLRARLRTVGVQEYSFVVEQGQNDVLRAADRKGQEVGRTWRMFDVGGARTMREKWYPYFDDLNAIIFLAPISCFDETLEEDPRVNRIKDSLMLWKGICGSTLLNNVQFVLFLNKCDLLSRKLKHTQAKVVDYFPDFREAQDAKRVAEFFRHEFKHVLKKSPLPTRTFYAHMTSVTDHKSTAQTLRVVRDGVAREALERSYLL
ncbi:G-alpha-domain-containing protein [Athelia psychrophila]|uniref:G-alpha-domain-containing protein n=1 Tax=Athelia psychrophila TaxID=1759441 RepID=A0A167W0B9_9AGAM|nr:G-alpha-domain-containing protein [Fibularhizoctonia sp. CBS 109695]